MTSLSKEKIENIVSDDKLGELNMPKDFLKSLLRQLTKDKNINFNFGKSMPIVTFSFVDENQGTAKRKEISIVCKFIAKRN